MISNVKNDSHIDKLDIILYTLLRNKNENTKQERIHAMNTKKPLYSQIQDYIAQRIDDGIWPTNYQLPPEREIAEQFGVSRITAKNALLGLVNKGYLYRHRGKGTFVATREPAAAAYSHSSATRSMIGEEPLPYRTGQRKLIGFILPWMEFNYCSQLISGMEAALSEQSYHLLFKRVSSRAQESQAIQDLLQLGVAGIVVVASQGDQPFNDDIVRLVLNKHPVVLVERTMTDMLVGGVYCNTTSIGPLMVSQLRKLDAREVALITYPSRYTIGVSDRISSFQAALAQQGYAPLPESRVLSISPSVLEQTNRDREHADIPEEIIELIQNNPEIDAIAAVDALLAQYAGRACKLLGRTAITIVSCDEPLYHPETVFPAAYIDQSPFEMGTAAARMIIGAIEHPDEPRKIMLEPRLVELR